MDDFHDRGKDLQSLQVVIYTGIAGDPNASGHNLRIAMPTSVTTLPQSYKNWREAHVSLKDATITGTPDLAYARIITIEVNPANTAVSDITFDTMYMFNNTKAKGTVLLCMDDGFSSVWDNLEYWALKGLPFSMFINSSKIDTEGYTTLANLKICQDEYNITVGSHSHTHADLTSLTLAELDAELKLSYNYLKSNGFDGRFFFAPPYGYYNDDVIRVALTYYSCVRLIYAGYYHFTVPHPNMYSHPAMNLGVSTTIGDATGMVDQCISRKTAVFFYGHKLVETPSTGIEWSITNWRLLADYLEVLVASGDIEVKNFRDFYNPVYTTVVPTASRKRGFQYGLA
jgi:peptidoglycan/xylan/chitin deacetylase (PgdA/CDA1 family)